MQEGRNNKKAKVRIRSLINSTFTKECMFDLYTLTLCPLSTNERVAEIEKILDKYGIEHMKLGAGTNRYAVLIDEYAVKIALDEDGMTDNKREMLYGTSLQPYVVKVYECMENGLIAVFEYVKPFDREDFWRMKPKMKEILKNITEGYLIGDIGITQKNFINWGMRTESDICILDFAYIYSVKYNVFTCPKCKGNSSLIYDENYVNLVCPICGSIYTFADIRKRISKNDEKKEIGDIKRCGYTLNHSQKENLFIPKKEFSPYLFPEIDEEKERKKEAKRVINQYWEDKWVDSAMSALERGESLDNLMGYIPKKNK